MVESAAEQRRREGSFTVETSSDTTTTATTDHFVNKANAASLCHCRARLPGWLTFHTDVILEEWEHDGYTILRGGGHTQANSSPNPPSVSLETWGREVRKEAVELPPLFQQPVGVSTCFPTSQWSVISGIPLLYICTGVWRSFTDVYYFWCTT